MSSLNNCCGNCNTNGLGNSCNPGGTDALVMAADGTLSNPDNTGPFICTNLMENTNLGGDRPAPCVSTIDQSGQVRRTPPRNCPPKQTIVTDNNGTVIWGNACCPGSDNELVSMRRLQFAARHSIPNIACPGYVCPGPAMDWLSKVMQTNGAQKYTVVSDMVTTCKGESHLVGRWLGNNILVGSNSYSTAQTLQPSGFQLSVSSAGVVKKMTDVSSGSSQVVAATYGTSTNNNRYPLPSSDSFSKIPVYNVGFFQPAVQGSTPPNSYFSPPGVTENLTQDLSSVNSLINGWISYKTTGETTSSGSNALISKVGSPNAAASKSAYLAVAVGAKEVLKGGYMDVESVPYTVLGPGESGQTPLALSTLAHNTAFYSNANVELGTSWIRHVPKVNPLANEQVAVTDSLVTNTLMYITGTYATPIQFAGQSVLDLPTNSKSAVFIAQVHHLNGNPLSSDRIYATQSDSTKAPATVSFSRLAQSQSYSCQYGNLIVIIGTWTGETLNAGRFSVKAKQNPAYSVGSPDVFTSHGFVAAYDPFCKSFLWLQTIQSLNDNKQAQVTNIINRENYGIVLVGNVPANTSVQFNIGAVRCTGIPGTPYLPNPKATRLTDDGPIFTSGNYNTFFVAKLGPQFGAVEWILKGTDIAPSENANLVAVDVDKDNHVYFSGNGNAQQPLYTAVVGYDAVTDNTLSTTLEASSQYVFVARTKNC